MTTPLKCLAARGLLAMLAIVTPAIAVAAGFATTVPLSAESATNIARGLFPVSLAAGTGTVFITDPVVVFIDDKRLGLRARFQAYEHRPEQGIAISEEGQALVTGEIGYDLASRQVLLYEPRLDELRFDRESDITRRLRADIQSMWRANVGNPVRADLPPHPMILPFRDNITGVTHDKTSIYIQLSYR